MVSRRQQREMQRELEKRILAVNEALTRISRLVQSQANEPAVLAALRAAAVEVTLATEAGSESQISSELALRHLIFDWARAARGIRVLAWDHLAGLFSTKTGRPLMEALRYASLTGADAAEARRFVELDETKQSFFANQEQIKEGTIRSDYPQVVYRYLLEAMTGKTPEPGPERFISDMQGTVHLMGLYGDTRPYLEGLLSGAIEFEPGDLGYINTWMKYQRGSGHCA
jgi:hypothetical protein